MPQVIRGNDIARKMKLMMSFINGRGGWILFGVANDGTGTVLIGD